MRILVSAAAALLPFAAAALTIDNAMITGIRGKVAYQTGNEEKTAVAFMKVKTGDKLILAKDANAQVVYLENGQQEIWQGPAKLTIGATASTSPDAKPEIKTLPPYVAKQLAKTPSSDVKNRTGMVLMRSIPNPDKLRQVEENYATLKAAAGPDDLTPEIYLLSGLLELREFEKLRARLDELSARTPSTELRATVEHFDKSMKIAAGK
jgi:hypothetical protein